MIEDAVRPAGSASDRALRRKRLVIRIVRWSGIAIVVALLLIQLVPYGRDHSNPAIAQTVAWDNPRTEELFRGACADCHSNETAWPWYSNVAPVSWLVQRDVDDGRSEFNISEPDGMGEAGEAAETVEEGSMPPWFYNALHGEARLSDQETEELINGLIATFGSED
jgi:mono/diheme cytochrome c family protein